MRLGGESCGLIISTNAFSFRQPTPLIKCKIFFGIYLTFFVILIQSPVNIKENVRFNVLVSTNIIKVYISYVIARTSFLSYF